VSLGAYFLMFRPITVPSYSGSLFRVHICCRYFYFHFKFLMPLVSLLPIHSFPYIQFSLPLLQLLLSFFCTSTSPPNLPILTSHIYTKLAIFSCTLKKQALSCFETSGATRPLELMLHINVLPSSGARSGIVPH